MSDSNLIYLSATEVLARFTERSLSPVDFMQATIDRIEKVNPKINAFTETYFESALAQAHESEKRYSKGRQGSLDGIPLAVKDEFKLNGTLRTLSSLIYMDRRDTETDVIIQRLLDAGAICHAKTNTPEFCLLGSCHSRLWGKTHNPWNLDMTPGGSSGGSGAALAAGMTTLATGSDIGGSIRIPASLCGVVGYKPPYGRNPEIPVSNLDFASHSGPMARTVSDIAKMQNLMSGPYNRDIASLRETVTIDHTPVTNLNGWKVAWSMDLGFFEIDEQIRTNTQQALNILEQLGASLVEVEPPWDASIIEAIHAYWAHGWASTMTDLLASHRKELTDYVIWFIENALQTSQQEYVNSIETMVDMYNWFGPLMDQHDLFICPTLSTSGVPVDFTWPTSEVNINNRLESMTEEQWNMTFIFNMLSRCPVLSVPSGLTSNGVPSAIQMVARTYDDQRVFSAALAYEQAFSAPGWHLDQRINL